ncbi:hypothetical protein [Nostoc sp.]|uniref:hypothetical protein n=1 Tax=Nostoc sp. TaxID=1180 RepID=UPI002FF64B01
MNTKYGSLALTMKTLNSKFFGKTNLNRWQHLQNYDPTWDERTKLIVSLIPKDTRIIEFGAGRRQLELYLDKSCVYFPSDLVSRGSETIVCDLNVRPLPSLTNLQLDIAVFGGVLEYIRDPYTLCTWLSQQVSICIVSYICAKSQPGTLGRLQETISRIRVGWVNTYSKKELESLFKTGGFPHLEKVTGETSYGKEEIFIFKK